MVLHNLPFNTMGFWILKTPSASNFGNAIDAGVLYIRPVPLRSPLALPRLKKTVDEERKKGEKKR